MIYYVINEKGEYSRKFENKNDLLYMVQCGWGYHFTNFYRKGVDDIYTMNTYLTNFCHSWGEYRAEWNHYRNSDTGHWYYKRRAVPLEEKIIDQHWRTVNLQDLAIKAWYSNPINTEKRTYWDSYRWSTWWEGDLRYEIYHKRCRHTDWSRPKRRGYRIEKCLGGDSLHKQYIRGKRLPRSLMMHKDRDRGRLKLTWKQLKVKKQWMAKQKENKYVSKD